MSAGREVAQRIDTLSSDLAQARRDTREALALAQAQAGRLGELEDTVRETQSQYHALQQAWQNFNDSASDELLANDVERLLTLANQQRLAGNVSNAIVALETAQRAWRAPTVRASPACNRPSTATWTACARSPPSTFPPRPPASSA